MESLVRGKRVMPLGLATYIHVGRAFISVMTFSLAVPVCVCVCRRVSTRPCCVFCGVSPLCRDIDTVTHVHVHYITLTCTLSPVCMTVIGYDEMLRSPLYGCLTLHMYTPPFSLSPIQTCVLGGIIYILFYSCDIIMTSRRQCTAL